jgi:hypothetical protein
MLALVLFAIALSVADRNEFIGVGIGCSLAAIAAYPWRSKLQDFSFSDRGIVLSDSGLELPWERLVDCRIDGNRIDPTYVGNGRLNANFGDHDIQLRFEGSNTRRDFYQRAWNQIFSNLEPRLDDLLAKILSAELQKHPTDSVFASGPVDMVRGVKAPLRVYFAMLLVTVGSFAGAVFSQNPTFSIIIAVTLIILLFAIGLLSFIALFRKGKSHVGYAGLVISPSRFVLQSKALSGEMKWSELKGVELKPNVRKPKVLRLKLEGVDVNLLEQYQLPLWYLYQKIQLFRSKYATSPIVADRAVPSPKVMPTVVDSNPYRPPSIE